MSEKRSRPGAANARAQNQTHVDAAHGSAQPQPGKASASKADAARFLECLDPFGTGKFTFQTFDDDQARKSKTLARVLHGTLDQHWTTLQKLNEQGAGVFLTINATDGKGRKADNITNVRAAFADLDGAPLEPVLAWKPPHIVVESSPGRWHAYWLVDDMPLDKFREAQKTLISLFGSDKSVHDLPRVMRLPGFYHRKGEPYLTRVVSTHDAPAYKAADFLPTANNNPASDELHARMQRDNGKGTSSDPSDLRTSATLDDIKAALTVISADDYQTWFEIGCALHVELGESGRGLFMEWSKTSSKFNAKGCAAKWAECAKVTEYTAGTIFHHATQASPEWRGLSRHKPPFAEPLELDPSDAMRSARAMVEKDFIHDDIRTLHRYRHQWWAYTGANYGHVDDEVTKSKIWKFLDAAFKRDKTNLLPFKPNRNNVSNVFEALGAVCQLDNAVEAPAWLTKDEQPPANQIFAAGNGLLHLPTRKLYLPTPTYFGLNASSVTFDKKAPTPAQWQTFLNQVLVEPEAIAMLQEWFGYALATDTSQQKILLSIGPKRSGKGTIARVLTELLGKHSVAGPTMSSLSETFGLEPLIAKPLAIISDARLGRTTNKAAIVERLLSISGEDRLTVPRKNILAWHGRLPTRIIILTNEMPSFSDGSGALVSRFIVLLFPHSFYGKEDVGLTDRLLTEAPGILNWAIDGYQRLIKRGHFIQPKNAKDAIEEMEMLGSPVKAFIRDRCDVGPTKSVEVDELYGSFRKWCESEGVRDPGSKEWFGRNLHTAIPGLKVAKLRADKADRVRVYQGVALHGM